MIRSTWEAATRERVRRGAASELDTATLALVEYELKVAEDLSMAEEKVAAATIPELLESDPVEEEWFDTGLDPAKLGKTPLALKVRKLGGFRLKVRGLQAEAEARRKR